MEKIPKRRNHRAYRQILGFTQDEVADILGTKKSNIANKELAEHKPFASSKGCQAYSLSYGIMTDELQSKAPDYLPATLYEPEGVYENSASSSVPHAENNGRKFKLAYTHRKTSAPYKISFAYKGRIFHLPASAILYSNLSGKKTELGHLLSVLHKAAVSAARSSRPLPLASLYPPASNTDYLLWYSTKSFPAAGVPAESCVLIKPRLHYAPNQLLLCKKGSNHYFTAQIRRPELCLFDTEDDSEHGGLNPICNSFEIIGQILSIYRLF